MAVVGTGRTRHDTAARRTRHGDVPQDYSRRAYVVLVMIVLFMIVNFGEKVVLGLAAVPIMAEFGIDRATFGTVASSMHLLYGVSGIVVGFVSARVSSRFLLAAMAIVWAISQLPVLVVTALPVLFVGRIVLGAAEGPATPISMHALYTWFPPDRRGLPSALQISGAALGALVAAPSLTWIIDGYGWRAAFLVLAAVSALWAVAWLVLGGDGPFGGNDARSERAVDARDPGAAIPPRDAAGRVPLRRCLLTGTFVGSVASAFGAQWAMAVNSAWLPEFLHTVGGFGPGRIASVVSLVAGVSLVLLLLVSPLSDVLLRRGVSRRWAHGGVQGAAVVVAGLAMVCVPFVDGGIRTLVLVVAFGVGAISFPLHYMTAAAVAPPGRRGAVFGILAAVGTLPGLVAPFVTGRIVDAAASVAVGYDTAFTVAAVIMLASGVLAIVLIRPQRDAARLVTTSAESTVPHPAEPRPADPGPTP